MLHKENQSLIDEELTELEEELRFAEHADDEKYARCVNRVKSVLELKEKENDIRIADRNQRNEEILGFVKTGADAIKFGASVIFLSGVICAGWNFEKTGTVTSLLTKEGIKGAFSLLNFLKK